MKVSVVIFPGSNCDHDIVHLYGNVLSQNVNSVWHKNRDLQNPDIVVIPGGFSFGDYLRTGALAKISPIMEEVRAFARRGGPVIAVCNGFQILCEAGLLPGVLLQNTRMKFLSQFVHMRIENTKTPFTRGIPSGTVITCPIAHFEGNYFADEETLKRLEANGQIVFRYCHKDGAVEHASPISNPNGASHSIAGVCNEQGNVVGLMPHPERAAECVVGYIGAESGRKIFETALGAI